VKISDEQIVKTFTFLHDFCENIILDLQKMVSDVKSGKIIVTVEEQKKETADTSDDQDYYVELIQTGGAVDPDEEKIKHSQEIGLFAPGEGGSIAVPSIAPLFDQKSSSSSVLTTTTSRQPESNL